MNDLAVENHVAPYAVAHTFIESTRTHGEPRSFYMQYGKRLFDLVLVCLALPALFPILLIATLAVALDGHRPFYSQPRIGRGGRIFRMWKFRSMVVNADVELEKYLLAHPDAAKEWQVYQKLKDDPRITFVGRVLRKTSIDELPQLWNVLTGSMSIVGPRPMMVDQASLYPGVCYYALRPGITGNWQVSDRNNSAFEDRAVYDSEYRRDLSFSSDVKIILQTIPAVLRSTGY